MLVVEIDLQFLHAGLQQVEVPTFRVGACGADELQVGVLGTEGITELLQALCEHGAVAAVGFVVVPLLIADGEELQVEGFGVAHVGTYLAPLAVDGTIGELHEIEGILNIGIELVEGCMYAGLRGVGVLELTRESAADDGQGLRAEILAELEELEETEAVALEIVGIEAIVESIVPAVLVEFTVLDGTYTVLPLVAGSEVNPLDDTAARETEYAGMHVIEGLCQILAHAVLTTFPGVRGEEGDVFHVGGGDRSLVSAAQEDAEGSLSLGAGRGEGGGVLLPLAALDLHLHFGKALVFAHGVVIYEADLES